MRHEIVGRKEKYSPDHDMTPSFDWSVHASSLEVVVLVRVIIAIISGVTCVPAFGTADVPVTTSTSAEPAMARHNNALVQLTATCMRKATLATMMTWGVAIVTLLPQGAVLGMVGDIRESTFITFDTGGGDGIWC